MKSIIYAVILGLGVLFVCLFTAVAISQPNAHAELHNPYWPFSVETSVLDK